MTFWNRLSRFCSTHTLSLIMLFAAVIGIIYIFIVPPWEHFDEPGHFEYAWLAANRSDWPQKGDFDQAMRREVGASMLEHSFHEYDVYQLLKTDEPISIITSQTGDLPLYYFLASLPLRLVKYSDLTFQLYVARLVSFALFLLVVRLTWQTSQEVFGENHRLSWMAPLFIICLPSFVDIMTAVNNDAAAIAAFSLFIHASTRLIKSGLSPRRGFYLLVSIILSMLAKSTAWLALPLSVLVILLTLIKQSSLKYVWLTLLIALIAGTGVIFSWKTSAPAYYYANKTSFIPHNRSLPIAPVGERAIVHQPQKYQTISFFHMLTPQAGQQLSGKDVTLGAWIWADSPTTIQYPVLETLNHHVLVDFHTKTILLTTEPQFFAFSAPMPASDGAPTWIRFFPSDDNKSSIFWDGIVLIPGDFSDETPPTFLEDDAAEIRWAGQDLNNLIRNASGEKSWPVFSEVTQKVFTREMNISSSKLLSILDVRSTACFYKYFLSRFFRSFWGIFGWGEVYLLGQRPYRIFAGFSLIALLGGLIGLSSRSIKYNKKIGLLFITAAASQLVLVTFRGAGSWFGSILIPLARYFYPAIIPLTILLVWAWSQFWEFVHKKTSLSRLLINLITITSLVALAIWGMLSLLVAFPR